MGRKPMHSDYFGERGLFSAFRNSNSSMSEAERMLSDFFNSSSVGLAIIDEHLRYRMVNPCLAATHNTPIESHIGKHLREILGDVAVQNVLIAAEPVLHCEVAGALPNRVDRARWTCSYFPAVDPNGTVRQVGAVVVELDRNIQFVPTDEAGSLRTALRSWKDIAQYVGTSVKTVQRWEQALQFPVRRVNPNKGSVVFAFQNEVEDWLRSRTPYPHQRRR